MRIFKESFTLVELLVVMGVLAVLVVTILVSLNPAEAQKKARDTKRMKDLRTLEAIVLQYIADNGDTSVCGGGGCASSTGAGSNTSIQSQPCNNNWITPSSAAKNLCQYTNSVPVDPANGAYRSFINGSGSVSSPGTDSIYGRYEIKMVGSNYIIRIMQESKSNANNTFNDGGAATGWAEVGDTSITL